MILLTPPYPVLFSPNLESLSDPGKAAADQMGYFGKSCILNQTRYMETKMDQNVKSNDDTLFYKKDAS